jgi:hypothetical protein
VTEVIREIHRRNRVLSLAGWFHLTLFVLALILGLFDDRLVMGINPWVKPMKFMASIALYLWTLAWFLDYLPQLQRSVQVVAWGASGTMVLETLCLWIQAARGTHSHFNVSTPFDATIFGAMGILILINSVLAVFLFLLFLRKDIQLPPVYLWGIRLGILVFLVGSLEGVIMIGNQGHAVGVPDGGAGLPFVNWSTEGGDLRIAHFFGLHGLQMLPLFGYLVHRLAGDRSSSLQFACLTAFAAVYVTCMAVTLLEALKGQPLIVI